MGGFCNMDIEIRPANEGDYQRLLELLAQISSLHHEGRPDFFRADAKKYGLEELREILTNPEKPVFAAVSPGGLLIGYAFCQLRDFSGHAVCNDIKALHIDDICVDEEYRRCGTGALLLEKCKELAKEWGCHSIQLNVWKFNDSAVKFYEKGGFEARAFTMEYILE